MAELRDKLSTSPDYITISGSGEPTLYSRIDELIDRIRSMTSIPVAVLTNGSLLWQEDVRRQLLDAHMVIPSLDAGDSLMFQAVNRPHSDVTFDMMLEGLIEFKEVYRGAYWLEVFLLASHTAIRSEVEKIRKCVERIKPDCVQLNTAVRPPAEDFAVGVEPRRMEELAEMFNPKAEVIADYRNVHADIDFQGGRDQVLDLLRRRPCTANDIADGLGMHLNEVLKYLEELIHGGLVTPQSRSGWNRIIYCASR
jgi:wyosine [tRNA(Phe)-imidazoG37] synthetase (radical SAM superfamily)